MRGLPHYISAAPARQEPRQTTVGELRLCCPISESRLCRTWAAMVCSVAMDGQDESVPLSRAAQRRAVVLNQLLAGELTLDRPPNCSASRCARSSVCGRLSRRRTCGTGACQYRAAPVDML